MGIECWVWEGGEWEVGRVRGGLVVVGGGVKEGKGRGGDTSFHFHASFVLHTRTRSGIGIGDTGVAIGIGIGMKEERRKEEEKGSPHLTALALVSVQCLSFDRQSLTVNR